MKSNLEYRVSELEKCQADVQAKLELIMTNHIPHIREDIASLKTEIRLMSFLNIGAIVLGILISKILT